MARGDFSIDRPIVLVGLMGAGKSTVGRRLAKRLELDFVDSDEAIEQAAGLGIAEIFERFGEAQFRDVERRVLARLVEGPPKVVAAGGGAFVDDSTRALILDRCIAVWLKADVDTLAKRASRREHRPLLRNRDRREVLDALAQARGPIYAEAHLAIESGNLTHQQTVSRIIEALAKRGR